MKRILIALFALTMSVSVFSQSPSFRFFYIAHDRGTPVNELCSRLQRVYEAAIYDPEYAVVFYLSDYDNPITVVVNLQGDNRDDFETILTELRMKSYHEIYADLDYENIINLINRYDFIDENGNPEFSSVEFNWYVNPDFWNKGYNEKLISSLYFNLELEKYKDYVSVLIWHAKDDELEQELNEEKPFGSKNLCKGLDFLLLPY